MSLVPWSPRYQYVIRYMVLLFPGHAKLNSLLSSVLCMPCISTLYTSLNIVLDVITFGSLLLMLDQVFQC